MCELFAMSSRLPADTRLSLEAFARHGGLEGPHKDGWGIAYYADEDVRLVKEPEPASSSACVRFIQDHPFAAAIVVGHIRRATQGRLAMKNCQPFARELGGRMHVFAHNGDLDSGALRAALPLGTFRPVGDTDSEYAFCALLERLRAPWLGGELPALEERVRIVAGFAASIRPLGPANFLYSDSDALFIHGHKRFHGDGAGARPPGLHVLCRRCAQQGTEQDVVIAASVPLTKEPGWRALAEGELVVAQRGGAVAAVYPAATACCTTSPAASSTLTATGMPRRMLSVTTQKSSN
ncbi:MAG TPA: class II glutamine amidotransferase [Burkholderiales bacterium]|nr:class II glutamine amidotransferase [Burkholderiales bacterium]